jgi:hypothetical protein
MKMPPRQKRKYTRKDKGEVETIEGEIVDDVSEPTSEREAYPERGLTIQPSQFVSPLLNPAQMRIIYNKTPEHAIKTRPGRGGKTFRYVPHGYVTDTLNKAFGFNWDFVLLPVFNGSIYQLSVSDEGGKVPMRNITVCGELTVRVRRGKEEVVIRKTGIGSQNWESTVEFGDAVKGAKSDALKVAGSLLGIALDLYYNEEDAIDEQQERKRKQREMQDLAEQAEKAIPDNVGSLLAKAKSELNLSMQDVLTKLGVTFPQLASQSPEEFGASWAKLS